MFRIGAKTSCAAYCSSLLKNNLIRRRTPSESKTTLVKPAPEDCSSKDWREAVKPFSKP